MPGGPAAVQLRSAACGRRPSGGSMGPLAGVRVVELAGIGPGPFCALLLADLGAEVLRVDRPAAARTGWPTVLARGRRSVAVDLKHPDGAGEVLDAAMVDGAALLTTQFHELLAAGLWQEQRGSNLLDGGAPFYGVYETADGRHLAVGALEPQFWAELLRRLGLDAGDLPDQLDRDGWPLLRERLAALFRTRTLEAWCELLAGTDACVAPVLGLAEAATHPHNRVRGSFVDVGGVPQPPPAPPLRP